MKTERRHELQTNKLADELGRTIQAARPYLKWVALGAGAVLVVILVASYVYQQRAESAAAAWADYVSAFSDPDQRVALKDVAEVHKGTAAGAWALLREADLQLAEGCQLLYQNRDEAEKQLRAAIEAYEQVASQERIAEFLAQRAQYGLGKAHESLGELKEARQAYDEVVRRSPESALGKLAAQQLAELKKEDVQAFYDWFVAQRPTPTPPAGTGLPSGLDSLPSTPDLDLPEGLTPPAETGPGTAPAGEGESAPATGAGEAAPATPAAEAPAPTTEPAAPTPPAEPPASDSGSPEPASDPSPPTTSEIPSPPADSSGGSTAPDAPPPE